MLQLIVHFLSPRWKLPLPPKNQRKDRPYMESLNHQSMLKSKTRFKNELPRRRPNPVTKMPGKYSGKLKSMLSVTVFSALLMALSSCGHQQGSVAQAQYFSTDTGLQTGGIKIIPIKTTKGSFKVWTKRIGNNPKIKVLLLTGGPGASHEYMECFESFFRKKASNLSIMTSWAPVIQKFRKIPQCMTWTEVLTKWNRSGRHSI